jgi:hypothetical protein
VVYFNFKKINLWLYISPMLPAHEARKGMRTGSAAVIVPPIMIIGPVRGLVVMGTGGEGKEGGGGEKGEKAALETVREKAGREGQSGGVFHGFQQHFFLRVWGLFACRRGPSRPMRLLQ